MYNKKKKKEKIHFFLQQTIESLYIYICTNLKKVQYIVIDW